MIIYFHICIKELIRSTDLPQDMSSTEEKALSVATYIGCGISIFCLLQTLFWMVILRYKTPILVTIAIHVL